MAEKSLLTTAAMRRRIRAAVKIIEDVKLVSALSGPPLDHRASFLNVQINADEVAESREEQLRKLFDFGCFEEVSLAYAKEHKS